MSGKVWEFDHDWRVATSGVTIISGAPGKYSLWAPSKFDSQVWWYRLNFFNNSGHFGPPLSWWAPGPLGIAGAADG